MVKQATPLSTASEAPSDYERPSQDELLAEADRLYEAYVKPLERDHHGQYVAVAADGRTVVGPSELEVVKEAVERFGRGSVVYKLGEAIRKRPW